MVNVLQTVAISPSRKARFDMGVSLSTHCGVPSGIVRYRSGEQESYGRGWRRLYGLDRNSGSTVSAFLAGKHADKILEAEIDARQLRESSVYRSAAHETALKNT